MNLKQLKYISVIAKSGSFTQAAKQLYISQPSLSEQVQKFEDEYGIKIFKRSRGRKIELTDIGKVVLDYAQKMTQLEDQLEQQLLNYQSQYDGEIRIGVFLTFFYQPIAKKVGEFRRKYSNLQVKYTILTSQTLLSRLAEGQLDVIFVTEEPSRSFLKRYKLKSKLISSEELQAVINKKNPLSKKAALSWQDFDGQSLMLCSQDSLTYPLLINQLNLNEAKPDVIGYSSQVDVNCQIAQHNLGIGFLSQSSFQSYPDKQNIKACPVFPTIEMQVHMIMPQNSDNEWLNDFVKCISY